MVNNAGKKDKQQNDTKVNTAGQQQKPLTRRIIELLPYQSTKHTQEVLVRIFLL